MTTTSDPKLLEKEFVLQDDDGRMYPIKAWLEINGDSPSLSCRWRMSQNGITLANYRCASEIDELVLIAREFFKVMRLTCYLTYRHRDVADPAIASWVARCLDEVRKMG